MEIFPKTTKEQELAELMVPFTETIMKALAYCALNAKGKMAEVCMQVHESLKEAYDSIREVEK